MELSKLLELKEGILSTLHDVGATVGELDYEAAFGKIYSFAPDPEKMNLSYLYDSINSANSTLTSLGFDNPAFQFFNITEKLCMFSPAFAALEISKGLVDKIKDISSVAATQKIDWNEITKEYDDTWDVEDIVNGYFIDDLPTITGQSGLVEKMIKEEYKEEALTQNAALDLDYQPTI